MAHGLMGASSAPNNHGSSLPSPIAADEEQSMSVKRGKSTVLQSKQQFQTPNLHHTTETKGKVMLSHTLRNQAHGSYRLILVLYLRLFVMDLKNILLIHLTHL